MINFSIFKSYDIRGIYPSELNEEAALAIGRAFIQHTKAKKVVVGRDMRLSSPMLHDALIRGILSQGADVFDMGEVMTEFIYFAVGNYSYDAGIMVTASHNPKEYNGLKMIKKEKKSFFMVRGKDLAGPAINAEFKEAKKKGGIKNIDVWQDYIKNVFSLVDVKKIKPFKVVIDAGNGMSGKSIPMIENKLPVKIIPLNFNLDGNFPAHPSNPLEPGSVSQISQKIKEEKADFGFIFDGDADRVYVLDEKGEFIQADVTLILLAKYFLGKNPKAAIAYNAICSKAVPEFITKAGGKPVRTQVGFVNVQQGLLKNKGIMGGELSGHYCFKDNFYGDSGLIAFLTLLQIISESGKKVSELTADLSPYFKSAEINFKIEDKEGVLKKIKEKYSDGKQDYLDGVTVEYKDWWFNARPSNTEPLLRLTIEANTKELLEEKKKELTEFITK